MVGNQQDPKFSKIYSEIDSKFNEFIHSEYFMYKRALKSCFNNLVEAFKINPKKCLTVEEFLGEKKAKNIETYRRINNNSKEYFSRINTCISEFFINKEKPNIKFSIQRDSRRLTGFDITGSFYRLIVNYKGRDFKKIFSEIERIVSLEETNYFLKKYLQIVEDAHRYLDTKHLRIILPVDNKVELGSEIYIKLKAIKGAPITDTLPLTRHIEQSSKFPKERAKEKRIVKAQSQKPQLVEEILKNIYKEPDLNKRHIVILGRPGSGKTTLLRYFAYFIASGKAKAEWGFDACIPVYINLSDYARSGSIDLKEYIKESSVKDLPEVDKNGIRELLEIAISECAEKNENNRVFFLLDGLDETREARERIIWEIERIHAFYKNAFIIVASRRTGYYDYTLPDFIPYQIEDFRSEDIDQFITVWFNYLAEFKAKENPENGWHDLYSKRAKFLIGRIKKEPYLKNIANIPLYLILLVVLVSDQKSKLPESRTGLYQNFIYKILDWEEKHGKGLPASADDLLDGFYEICWAIHRSLFGNIDKYTNREFIKKSIKGSIDIEPNELIDFWIRADILIKVQAEHGELIMHRHLSFLEYGFACKLARLWDDQAKRDDVWEKLKPNIHNSYLYEPLLLFVEQLENPATFITKVWGLKDDIFRNNLIFISYALNQVKTKMQDKAIFKDLLKELLDVWQSESPFAAQTDSHLIKCILLIGGIQELVEAFSRITQSEGRVKIIKAISRLKDKSVISVLTGLIENENDSEVRETIIRNIIKLSDKNNLPLLEKLLKNEYSPQLKSKIVRFLVNDVEDAIPFLIKLYKNETDLEVKDTIIRLIRKHGDKNAIPLLKPLFEKEIYELVRYRLAKLIAALGGKQSAVLYFEELFNRKGNSLDDSYVKMELIYYIGEMGDINALPILKSLLKRSYNIEGLYEDVELKISILNAIGTIGDKDYAFRKIKEIYDDEADFSAKMYQADLIAKFGNKESAIKCLQKSLENETIPNRIVDIIDAILKICDYEINNPYLKGSIMSHLKGQYQKENSYGVRRNFVESIGMVGGKNDIPFLKEIFEKEDSVHVRRAIVKSIENLGDENDIPFLKEIFEKEENFRERRDIVKSIESLGDENTTPILKELFEKEKHSNVRYALAISIGNLGSKDTLTFLKSHFSTEDNSLVKRGLSKSIAKLADKKDSVLYFKEIIESQDNANVKIDYAHAIHEIVKTENLQVFEGEGTQWDFKKITERYTF